jgi:protein-S-isoprenylcysteine O-methyltransferase Ste14
MQADRKELIFNGFGILSSVFILLSGAIVARAMVDFMVQIFGALLIIWAVVTIRVNKDKNKLPKRYFFITTGPYEIIRHPVYAGYLLIMVSFVEIEFTFLRLIALVILCMVIFMKIIREEDITMHEAAEYKNYKRKTKAIIPYLL